MCYSGKCKYENHMGDCTITDGNSKCPDEIFAPPEEITIKYQEKPEPEEILIEIKIWVTNLKLN